MPEPIIYVRTDERVFIVGANGTGKTTLVRYGMLPAIPLETSVIVIDPKRDKIWRAIRDVKFSRITGKPKLENGKVRAYRWPRNVHTNLWEEPSFLALLTAIWEDGNALIIFDDCGSIFDSPFSLPPIVSRLEREGRQRNIGIWHLTQRPSMLPVVMLTECESWAIFTLRALKDRITCAGYVGDEVREKPPQSGLRTHTFWWSRPGMRSPRLVNLKMKGAA